MAFSTDITLSGSFVNLNSVSGLATNLNFIIQNKTSKDVVIIASASQPTDATTGINVRPYELVILPPSEDPYWGYGFGDVNFQMYSESLLDQAIRYYPNLVQPRLLTTTLTNAENLVLLGVMYRCIIEISALASGSSVWYRVKAPSNRELAIINRRMVSKFAGTEYRLFYDSTGYTQTGIALPAYNMNRRINTTPTTTIYALTSAPTTLNKDIGPIIYTGAGSGGVGNATAGTNSREDGFTIYPANDFFIAKITNLASSANDIKVILEFAELDSTIVTS